MKTDCEVVKGIEDGKMKDFLQEDLGKGKESRDAVVCLFKVVCNNQELPRTLETRNRLVADVCNLLYYIIGVVIWSSFKAPGSSCYLLVVYSPPEPVPR